ncbi:MAG: Sec-independent protein translocase protein TatB [Proteobacteria bacterium]|nr:Sec-independent protein translocase protein TatB [Pseudomonadota bacterium]
MFDLAWSELFVIGLVAVLVLGPKELPTAMRTLAKAIRKVRNLGSEFQGHFNEMLREAELDEVRKQVQKFSQTSLVEHVTNYVDPKGEVAKEVTSAFQDPDSQTPPPADQAVAASGTPDGAAAAPPAQVAPAETVPAETVPAEQKPPAAT